MLATVIYSGFAGWQLYEIHSGAKDTHDLAVAAKKQADKSETISQSIEAAVTQMEAANLQAKTASKETFGQSEKVLNANIAQSHLDQRAWVGIKYVKLSTPTATNPVSAEVGVTNTGKTNALRTTISLHIGGRLNLINRLEANGFTDPEKSVATIFPQQELVATSVIRKPDGMPAMATEGEVSDFKVGKLFIYVWGEIDYYDIFDKAHMTHFCNYFTRGDAHGVACEMHNEAN